MARLRGASIAARIFILLLLVVVLFVGGVLWFDYLDLISAQDILDPVLGPVLALVGLRQREEIVDEVDPLLLERERLAKQMEALLLKEDELVEKESRLAETQAEMDQKAELLVDREKALANQEKSFNERTKAYDNRRVSLEQKSRYLTSMPPDNAVAILLQYENDMDILDVFRVTDEMAGRAGEQSLVAYWLSKMPPERGAELTRKMGRENP